MNNLISRYEEKIMDVGASVKRALRHQLLPEPIVDQAIRMRYVCDVELDKVVKNALVELTSSYLSPYALEILVSWFRIAAMK